MTQLLFQQLQQNPGYICVGNCHRACRRYFSHHCDAFIRHSAILCCGFDVNIISCADTRRSNGTPVCCYGREAKIAAIKRSAVVAMTVAHMDRSCEGTTTGAALLASVWRAGGTEATPGWRCRGRKLSVVDRPPRPPTHLSVLLFSSFTLKYPARLCQRWCGGRGVCRTAGANQRRSSCSYSTD